jgi:hypothetical protein
VTFSDINVIGTSSLRLQPNVEVSNAYLDVYLTGGPDIHIAGNGETVIVGSDAGANVSVQASGNVAIQANAVYGGTPHTWMFDYYGDLTLPGEIKNGTAGLSFPSGGVYLTTNLDDDNNALYFDPTSHDAQLYVGGNITLSTAVVPGDSELDWTFGTDGALTVPGNIHAQEGNDINVRIYNPDVHGGATFQVENRQVDIGNSKTTQFTVGPSSIVLTTDFSDVRNNWTFGTAGNLSAPGEITITTNNTHGGAGYTGFLTLTSTQGGVTNPNKFIRLNSTGNLQIVNSAYTQTIFDLGDSGDLKLLGNVNVGNVVTTGTANIGGNLIVGGNLLLSAGGQIQSPAGVGNVTIEANDGNNVRTWAFETNGNITFPDATTQGTAYQRVTGSWTVTTGSANYSFTVPQNGTYTMWVRGNIPNGIITWNATATVTNNNVPVLGQQFAWNYNGVIPIPLEITALPVQFIGTANTIITSNTYGGGPSNTFEFTVNNASGSPQTVYWGYVAQ